MNESYGISRGSYTIPWRFENSFFESNRKSCLTFCYLSMWDFSDGLKYKTIINLAFWQKPVLQVPSESIQTYRLQNKNGISIPLDIIIYNCGIQVLITILLKQVYLNSLPWHLGAACFSIGNFHMNPRWEI